MACLGLATIFMCLTIIVQAKCCSPPVTEDHLKLLDDMIDAQLNTSCSIKVKLIDNTQLEDYCYNRMVISQLFHLLEGLKFKENSQSYNHAKTLNELYNQRFKGCIDEEDEISEDELSDCSQVMDLSPTQYLQRIKMSFVIFGDFKEDSNRKCSKEYKMCKKDYNHLTKGPQCACPSPTTTILSGTTTQKSLSKLSETKSTPYASVSTVPLTEYMSSSELQNSQQRPESVEMSSVILTSIPTDIQPLTTIMDNLHATTTDHLVSGPESPHIKMDISFIGMEFTKDITESTYTTSLSQTRTFETRDQSLYNTERINTDGSHTEQLSTTTTVLNKDFSQITEELTSVVEPDVNELLESTEPNTILQTLVSNIQTFSESSLETGVESSSSSTVTKMRRSITNEDKIFQLYLSTHAQPVLASDDSATKIPYSTFPPTVQSRQTTSQESEIRNLGWAASYLFSTMITTKPASSEDKMSSPISGVQSLLSEASLHPKLTAHGGGYTYDNSQQQERNVAAFISEDRENKDAGPIHSFNLLPMLKTVQQQDGRQKSNLLLVMIPSFLAILFLCGLLYFMYHYRLLRRQLSREQTRELPELRPLAE